MPYVTIGAKANWGEDANEFKPERFLESKPKPFGKRPRRIMEGKSWK